MISLHDPERHSFFSDNLSGIHPEVLAAIGAANGGCVDSYGDDPYTRRLQQVVGEHFGQGAAAFPVFNGTGANVLALEAATPRWGAVLAPESSHTNTEEAGAPEQTGGLKIISVPTADGKLRPDQIHEAAAGLGDQHLAQPLVVSIADASELGTVYTPAEVVALTRAAHDHGMLVHLDGARLANAAAHLGVGLGALTAEADVDVVSLGGTKNGAMIAEAVVVPAGDHAEPLARAVRMLRKATVQLASKMRYVSAQLIALFEADLWLRNATVANDMAARLAAGLAEVPGVGIAQKVQSNAVFTVLPADAVEPLSERFGFHGEGTAESPARLMCGFDTTQAQVDELISTVRRLAG